MVNIKKFTVCMFYMGLALVQNKIAREKKLGEEDFAKTSRCNKDSSNTFLHDSCFPYTAGDSRVGENIKVRALTKLSEISPPA